MRPGLSPQSIAALRRARCMPPKIGYTLRIARTMKTLFNRGLPQAVLIGSLVAWPAVAQSVADEVNGKLPAWLHIGGLFRTRLEGFLNRGFAPGEHDAHLVNRFRLDVGLRVTGWMKFAFEGQDARIYFEKIVPNAPPFANPMDLRLGYLEIGDIDTGTLSLRAGRQDLNFGEQRLLGNFNWINVGRSFDAVRLTLRHGGCRLDAFASSVVNPTPRGFDRPQTGNNLHGLYGSITKLVPASTIEPYVLWRIAPQQISENGTRGTLDLKTVGVRWVGKANAIDYGTEMAGQFGGLGPDRVRAWAGHWVLGYTIPHAAWQSRLSAEYNHATGDKDPRDGIRGTFDVLYPSPHDQYGLCDQVGWRNINDIRFGWDAKPARKLGVILNYHDWWLASARDALYSPTGAPVARRIDGSAGRRVGRELDLQASYVLTPNTSLGAGIGHIFLGEFLKRTTDGAAYTFPFIMATYTF